MPETRPDLAYNAAHARCLAAPQIRFHGIANTFSATDPARLFHGAEECAWATVQMGMCGLEGFDTFCHAPVWVGGEFDLNGIEHAVAFQEDVDLGPAGGAPVVKCWAGG
jgi:hypothetical protein